jgi:peptide chain release factor
MKHTDHISLLVTAGDGPVECNQAVGHILKRMADEAVEYGITMSVHPTQGRHGPKSAIVVVHGTQRQAFCDAWCGTIQWRIHSQLRKTHKRANWFVGVYPLGTLKTDRQVIQKSDVVFSTLRAGGPGGQHQNTTDSAVRAVHSVLGLSVVVREARSQHRNKALALERLQNVADAQATSVMDQRKSTQNQMHRTLERGNPVRRFVGSDFTEDKRAR